MFFGIRQCSSVGEAIHFVFYGGGSDHAALTDEPCLVHPGVALVGRLQAGVREEIFIAEIGAGLLAPGPRHYLLGQFDEPRVLHVDVSPVVGAQLEPHVEPAEAVRAGQEPVATADMSTATEPLP